MVRGVCLALLFCPTVALAQVKLSTPPSTPTVLPTKGIVREVQATDRSMIELTLREGFTSMVFLPDGEGIVAIAGGGGRTKEGDTMWPIDWTEGQPIVSVRPSIAGIETNLHVTSTSGVTYSFMLRESKHAPPDLKVYLAPSDEKARAGKVRFVPATDVDQVRLELQRTMASVETAQKQAAEAVEAFKQAYPLRLKHYAIANTPPFFVLGMFHDGVFTRITTTARELPVIVEIKDDMPAEVNFQVQGEAGQQTYLIPKVLGSGYLKLGKARLAFTAPAETARGN